MKINRILRMGIADFYFSVFWVAPAPPDFTALIYTMTRIKPAIPAYLKADKASKCHYFPISPNLPIRRRDE